MHRAVFVLSTGRCGTQWLAAVLAHGFGVRAVVEHEPLGAGYAARAMLAAGDPAALPAETGRPILEHVEAIERTLETRSYVECGHPSWSTLPYLARRLRDRIHVVHLVRHPVPTALSWVTESAYVPPLAPHLAEKVLVSPFDAGVRHGGYRDRWSSLTPYEKALFYWLEVNASGLALEREAGVPWTRARFEDLVRGSALSDLLEGLGADRDIEPIAPIDEYRFLLTSWSDPYLIAGHPEVLEVARQLGYDPLAFDVEQLRRRYYQRW